MEQDDTSVCSSIATNTTNINVNQNISNKIDNINVCNSQEMSTSIVQSIKNENVEKENTMKNFSSTSQLNINRQFLSGHCSEDPCIAHISKEDVLYINCHTFCHLACVGRTSMVNGEIYSCRKRNVKKSSNIVIKKNNNDNI